jgi:hypothetical protein
MPAIKAPNNQDSNNQQQSSANGSPHPTTKLPQRLLYLSLTGP